MPYEKIGRNEPVCIADEVPFEIPDSWEWVRLGGICEIARGGSPRPIKQYLTNSSHGTNWIKIGDSDKGGKYINQTREKIFPEGATKSRMVHKGDFLLTNSMSFGRPYILNVDGCIHDGWLVLSGYSGCYDKDFLYYMLSSRFAYFQFCDVVSGAVVKNLNIDKVAAALFPIPPFKEQKRIVEIIEKIEALIDEYDIVEKNFSALNGSFADRLKKSILQMAVQGKLVPQNLSDETAETLLERVRAEKQKLIKEGKIKKSKQDSVISKRDNSHYERLDGIERCIDDELPFEIPKNWEWVRLHSLVAKEIRRGKAPKYSSVKGVQVFAQKCNVKSGGIDMTLAKFLDSAVFCNYPQEEYLQDQDIIINSTGNGTLGRIGVFHNADRIDDSIIVPDSHVTVIRFLPSLNKDYLLYVLKYYQPYLEKLGEGSTNQTELKPAIISNLLIPMAPLSEQSRITGIVEETIQHADNL